MPIAIEQSDQIATWRDALAAEVDESVAVVLAVASGQMSPQSFTTWAGGA